MEDAIAKRDRQIAKLLFESQMHDVFSKIESLKPQALDALRAMPDFSLKLDWKFASSVFGFLLRRFAPRDTYSITKVSLPCRLS